MPIRPLLDDVTNVMKWDKKREEITKGFYSVVHHAPFQRNTRDIVAVDS